jgi:3',5'-cyclic AMP phosphodiesterase CpdA
MKRTKAGYRILAISDTHCGHVTGLTPPAWWTQRLLNQQAPPWEWFTKAIEGFNPDIVIWTGDLIDGKGAKSGGSELLVPTCLGQAEMATELVKIIGAKSNIFCHGTGYHTSEGGEDYETVIAREVGGEIYDSPLLDVGGVIINARHHIGGTSVAYGATPLSKEKLADTLWADAEGRDKANIILRGHVHRHNFLGGVDDDGHQWVAMTLPALQLWTKFGGRRVTGQPITYGVTFIEVKSGSFAWRTKTLSLKGSREIIRFSK